MKVQDIFMLISNNGLAIVLLVWVLWRADKYISIFIPKLDDILHAVQRQTLSILKLSDEIHDQNGKKK